MPKRRVYGGRSTIDRFVGLPHWMLRSHAWRILTPVARAALIEVLAIYNGSNNGYLALSARTAAERTNCSKDTAARAFHELCRAGFLELSIQGAFHRKDRHASEWRVTLHPCNRTHEPASNAFMRLKPAPQNLKLGPITGTDGPSYRTVTRKVVQNTTIMSLTSDCQASYSPVHGPTTGTHIRYHSGSV
jgi:hypothetical protein